MVSRFPFVCCSHCFHLDTISKCFSKNSVEEIKEALIEDSSEYARKTLAKLNEKSPASLKVTLRLIREGQESGDLIGSMEKEYAIAKRLWDDRDSDFHFGMDHVVFGENELSHPLNWPKDPTDEYVESLFSNVQEEAFSLDRLEPRKPMEWLQVLDFYQERDMTAVVREDQIVTKLMTPEERKANRKLDETQIIRKQRMFSVMDISDLPAENESGHKRFEFVREGEKGGLELYAKDYETNETVKVPPGWTKKILSEYEDRLDKIAIFRETELLLHPVLEALDPSIGEGIREFLMGENDDDDVGVQNTKEDLDWGMDANLSDRMVGETEEERETRMAMRKVDMEEKEKLEEDLRAEGGGEPSEAELKEQKDHARRTNVHSESIQWLMAEPYSDANELDMEHMELLMEDLAKVKNEQIAEKGLNPEYSRRPLTEREKHL